MKSSLVTQFTTQTILGSHYIIILNTIITQFLIDCVTFYHETPFNEFLMATFVLFYKHILVLINF